MDLPIVENTNFTLQFLLDKLSADAKLLDTFEIQQLSESAFMSTVYRVKFSWKSPTMMARPNSVILKVPGPKYDELIANNNSEATETNDDASFREFFFDYLEKAHKREITFYKCFNRLDPSNGFVPKVFYGADFSTKHREGLLIMDDLTDRACSVPVLPGLNDAQVHAVLIAIARLHATGWAHWHELMGEVWPGGGTVGNCWALEQPFVDSLIEATKQLAKIEPNAIGPLVQRLLPLFRVENSAQCFYDEGKYGFPPCFVHGDLWSPNIMWTKNMDGRASDELCAIIDWQTVHSGNPCEDICRLLALNTTSAYRRANTDQLLAFYAEKVAAFMGDRCCPFTLAQLKMAYAGAMPYTMMFLCYGASVYCTMDTVVGKEGTDGREEQCTELFHRVQAFLEDTEKEFRNQIFNK